jgi:hypothetical protein
MTKEQLLAQLRPGSDIYEIIKNGEIKEDNDDEEFLAWIYGEKAAALKEVGEWTVRTDILKIKSIFFMSIWSTKEEINAHLIKIAKCRASVMKCCLMKADILSRQQGRTTIDCELLEKLRAEARDEIDKTIEAARNKKWYGKGFLWEKIKHRILEEKPE